MSAPQALICIPTYNELENIQLLLPEVMDLPLDLHVLVIDDGSPDGTALAVQKMQENYSGRIHLLSRKSKSGLGSAYVAGFKWALEHGYERIFEMDADFSHHPKYLADFLKASENAEVVLGSRYKDGKISVVNWDWKRLLLSYCGNLYAKMVTGLPISDATGGFKCFHASALRAINLDQLQSGGYSFQIETSYRLWKKGFRFAEVPIVFTDRTIGQSKLSGKIIREALFVLLKLRLGK